MSKLINIQESTYTKLKQLSDGRSMSATIELLLNGKDIPVTTPSPVVEPYKQPQPIVKGRNTFDVLKDIQSIKDEYKDKLEYCQDTDTRASLEQELQDTLDSLWLEYNSLKANI
jgi:hypothetical protein